jgi:hypothetical protein
MYEGVLKLDVLALVRLELRMTSQGLTLDAQAVLKNRNGIGPPGQAGYSQTTTWPREVVDAATTLVELVEKAMGQNLGPGGTTMTLPPDLEEPADIASALRKDKDLQQF